MKEQQLTLESEIIRQAQNGDQEAFGNLYQRHLEAIQQYIQKRVTGNCDAEDLTQTVFLKAWQALHKYQPTAIPFRAWLYRIAHNTVIDHYRMQRKTLQWDDLTLAIDADFVPESIVLKIEQRETVQRAIAMLPPWYRELIEHRFLRNMDYAETAAELGHQVNNLRVLQHRALDALRQVLSQELALGFAIAITLMLLGREMVVATVRALPGEKLYQVRTVVEEVRLFLADDAADVRLHSAFATQRLAELSTLIEQGRSDDLAVTATRFAEQLDAASDKLVTLAQADQAVGRALTPQFEDTLREQAAQLATVTAALPKADQTTLKPAIESVIEVQTRLHEQSQEQNLEVTPTPAGAEENATSSLNRDDINDINLLPSPTPTATASSQQAQIEVNSRRPLATPPHLGGETNSQSWGEKPSALPVQTETEQHGEQSASVATNELLAKPSSTIDTSETTRNSDPTQPHDLPNTIPSSEEVSANPVELLSGEVHPALPEEHTAAANDNPATSEDNTKPPPKSSPADSDDEPGISHERHPVQPDQSNDKLNSPAQSAEPSPRRNNNIAPDLKITIYDLQMHLV